MTSIWESTIPSVWKPTEDIIKLSNRVLINRYILNYHVTCYTIMWLQDISGGVSRCLAQAEIWFDPKTERELSIKAAKEVGDFFVPPEWLRVTNKGHYVEYVRTYNTAEQAYFLQFSGEDSL